MKRTLLLALGAFFLQSAVCLAQEPSPLPQFPIAPASPSIIDEGSALPMSTWMGSPRYEPRIWGGAEALMWWTKSTPVNTPLLTSALVPFAIDPTAGQIGSANTSVLLGGQSYDLGGPRLGGRFTLGGWLDSEDRIGIEANYLYIAPRTITRAVNSDGSPGSLALAIPYFDVNAGSEASFNFTGNAPGFIGAGGAFLRLSNELQGGEFNFVGRLVRNQNLSLDGLLGFRYVNFSEDLEFASGNVTPLNGGFYTTLDNFHASNNFYGGQVGLHSEYRLGNFFIEGTAKVALGSMQQIVDVSGSSNSGFAPPSPAIFNYIGAPGGWYAQPTNIGQRTHYAFAVVPEADLKFGYNITRNIQAFVAYNYLYLSDVARPGTLLDHTANTTQNATFSGFPNTLTGPPAPNFSFNRSDFWAQGINFGVQFKF